MNTYDKRLQEKRTEVLNRLRDNLGEDRSGDLGDVDGVSLMTRFLRRLPDEESDDGGDESGPLTKTELGELRRRRRKRRRESTPADLLPQVKPAVPAELDIDSDAIPIGPGGEDAILESIKFDTLVKEIPRLRDNFSEWLSSVDAEYTPNSSSLEELERHRKNVEYRLKALTVMLNATQHELDELIVTIRAKETVTAK
ncbi:MAG: hypothetical protein U9Q81_19865 [Pseudomonadota bacterium]|nr:hypothetical protein [Pseudomonadota bacterium]